jgi:hypothetical protein
MRDALKGSMARHNLDSVMQDAGWWLHVSRSASDTMLLGNK